MEHFSISLAGIPIGVACRFSSTTAYCSRYLCHDVSPALTVEVTMQDIDRERHIDRERQVSRGTENSWSDAYLETLALYRKICDGLIDYDVLLFHGSVIDVDGKGYLFAAASGTGKSTHAALWRKVLPPLGHSVRMINDDKPLLRFTKEDILACGTPWNGKHHLDTNDMVPLSAIGQIVRSPENKVQKLAGEAFWPMALRQCYMPQKPEAAKRVLMLLQRLHDEVPCCQIFCNMEPEAALVSWQGMSGVANIIGKE